MEKPVIIGRFGKVFGIKGWINVISFTTPPENILSYQPWWLEEKHDGWSALPIEHTKGTPKRIQVKIAGCDTPEDAQHYVNLMIATTREKLPTLDKAHYYWTDLEGLLVKNTDGIILGEIDYLFETGANDVIVVKNDKPLLIPYVEDVVIRVDLTKKIMLVDWDASFS